MAPATIVALIGAWLALPGSPWLWTALILGSLAFPLYPLLPRLLAGPPPQQPLRMYLRLLAEDAQTAAAQVLLVVVFLAYHGFRMVHAIALTLPESPAHVS